MSVIDNIAKLVLADPNVTTRQIAKQLGYAEEKSVYYWLSKSGYTGIKDFKKAVLRSAVPLPKQLPTVPVARDSSPGSFPVFSDLDQRATGLGLVDHLEKSLGSESYCVLLTESRCEPLAAEGDILLIDPGAPAYQGDLQLASTKGKLHLVRQYATGENSPLFIDASRPGSLVTPDFVSGKVMFILRKQP